MTLPGVLKASEKRLRTVYVGVCSREGCDEVFFTISSRTRNCSRRCGKWKTGIYKDPKGYIRVRQEDGSYKYQHRIVLEEKLSRPLQPGETAHHIDGDKGNNNPENLELWMSQPAGQRVRDLVAMIVTRYPDAVRRELERLRPTS